MPKSIDLHLYNLAPPKRGAFLLLTDTAAGRCYDQGVAPRPPMSEEQLKAFLEKVKGDSNLQEKLKAAKSPEDVIEIAKENGHEFTADKINQLSEEELERLAGGTDCCLTEFAPTLNANTEIIDNLH